MNVSRGSRATSPVLVNCLVIALAGCAQPITGSPTAIDTAAASPAAGNAGPAQPDPCKLVTKAEAEKLAGHPLKEPVPAADVLCYFTAATDGPTAQVEVGVGDGVSTFLEIERNLGHDLTPLSGAGDEAFVETDTAFIFKSGVKVSLHVVRLEDPATYRSTLENLARTVAGRI